jgi:hypothetical protein
MSQKEAGVVHGHFASVLRQFSSRLAILPQDGSGLVLGVHKRFWIEIYKNKELQPSSQSARTLLNAGPSVFGNLNITGGESE